MAEDLETKARKAVLRIDKNVADIKKDGADTKKDVSKMRETLWDIGRKLCYVLERRFDYHTLPEGIDYE